MDDGAARSARKRRLDRRSQKREVLHETHNGSDMSLYNKLLDANVESIARTFQKRVAAGLQSGRDFVIPNQDEQASETTDFDLVTWLVVKHR